MDVVSARAQWEHSTGDHGIANVKGFLKPHASMSLVSLRWPKKDGYKQSICLISLSIQS